MSIFQNINFCRRQYSEAELESNFRQIWTEGISLSLSLSRSLWSVLCLHRWQAWPCVVPGLQVCRLSLFLVQHRLHLVTDNIGLHLLCLDHQLGHMSPLCHHTARDVHHPREVP